MDRDEGTYRPYLLKAIVSMETLGGLGELGWGIGLVLLSDLIPKGNISLSHLGTGKILIYGYSSIVLSVLSFLVALGVWSLRKLGRNIALAAMAIGLFIPIFVAGVLGQFTFVFNLIAYPLMMYYLMRKETAQLYK